MAIERIVNIIVKDNASVSDKHVKELDKSLNKLEGSNKGVTGSMKESSLSVLENGGAMGLLNDATGGMAMSVKDAVESMDLFSKGSKIATAATALQTWVTNGANVATKAFRATLLTTGIGAVVVLISALVVAMSNMESSAEKAEHAQKLLNDEIERSNNLLSSELSDIEYVAKAQVLRAEKQGKSVKEIQAIENGASTDRLKALKNEEARLLKAGQDKNKTPEQAKAINDALIKNTASFNKEIQNQELDRLTKERDIAVKSREVVTKSNTGTQTSAKDHHAKLLADRKEYLDKANAFGEENNLKAVDTEKIQRDAAKTAMLEDLETKVAIGNNWVKESRHMAEQEIADAQAAATAKQNINATAIQSAQGLVGILAGLGEKNKKIQKVALVASAGLSIAEIINNTNVGSSKEVATKGVFGLSTSAVLYAKMGVSIASVLAATAKGMSALGGGGGSAGGGDGGRPSTAPQFNIVGQNSNNQLAQSIGNSQNRPVEAFVVSGNMTTAQSLDRNRIATATFNN